MSQNIFIQLLYQFINGGLIAEEKFQLNEMINQPDYNIILEDFVKKVMLSENNKEIENPEILGEILVYLRKHMNEEKEEPNIIPLSGKESN